MKTIWIIGGGSFGTRAVRRLRSEHKPAKTMVVDRDAGVDALGGLPQPPRQRAAAVDQCAGDVQVARAGGAQVLVADEEDLLDALAAAELGDESAVVFHAGDCTPAARRCKRPPEPV